MRKSTLYILFLFIGISTNSFAQDNVAKKLLDEVSTKMTSYKNMKITFTSSLTNKEAGINEGDEPPMQGTIFLEGEKYNLDYIGNSFIFDGKKLYVINHDEKEIAINDSDFDAGDGFIYPSKLLTFYQEGYTYKLGKTATIKGKKIQLVELTPIDSNSDIVKVELSIDLKTKHIYKLAQIGSNTAKTTFTITSFKGNQTLPKGVFTFNKDSYLKKNYIID